MKYELHTEIVIDAPADRVWSVLIDFASYPSWNPFVLRASGTLAVGERLSVVLKQRGSPKMPIKPRVSIFEAGKRFAWRGLLLSRSLFVGEHRFEVIPVGPSQCRLIQAEQFGGVLIPLFKRTLDTATRAAFMAMNEALKRRAEARQ